MNAADLRLIVECAALAPSVHNTQPWRFTIHNDIVEVRADRSRSLDYLDPTGRQMLISCGAAVEFARLAARAMGRECVVEMLPDRNDPDLVARLRIGRRQRVTELELHLAHAMARRYTDRSPYDGRPVPRRVLRESARHGATLGTWLRVVTDPVQRNLVAATLAEAEAAEAADPDYADELSRWTRATTAPDGVPHSAVPQWPESVVSDVPLRDFTGHAAHPRPSGHDEPPEVERDTLVVLGSDGDDPGAWVATGRSLAWLLLRATAAGVSSQPLGPATDLPAARLRLRHDLGLVGYPQFLLRLGYGSDRPRAGRRSVEDVLVPVS